MGCATLGGTLWSAGFLKLCFGTMTFGDVRGLFKGHREAGVGQAGADDTGLSFAF